MATKSGQRPVVTSRSPHSSAVKGVQSEPTLKTSTSAGARRGRPSDRLNPKTVDPFGSSKKSKSAFASVYNNGGIPCRLVHGSVKHKLAWNTAPEDVSFDTVLVTLAQGLQETVHPYTFVARQGFKELLQVADADVRTQPLLSKLSTSLRAALGHSVAEVFEAGLECLILLSAVVGPALNPHLKMLLIPITKRLMEKKYRERITDGLQQLEQNGGQEAKLVIKSKIPTYHSVIT